MKILFLCDYNQTQAATILDHLNAFRRYSGHETYFLTGLTLWGGNIPRATKLEDDEDDYCLDLGMFDVLVVHYSLALALESYVSPATRRKIRDFKGLKVLFVQDEYRFVNSTIDSIRTMGFDLVFTCVPENAIEKVYPPERVPGVRFVQTLTGYVPEGLKIFPTKALHEREYDVSYRGRKYPAWHGRLGLEKWRIAERFEKDARRSRLKTNISVKEADRLYGLAWTKLLMNSVATLAVESGCSVFDFDASISTRCETYNALLRKRPDEDLPYEKLKALFFEGKEDVIPLEQISPRVFEAITARTLVVAYEGKYSGILKPWRHYIPLLKDHSNMDEVVDFLRNREKVAMMISDAYYEIAMNRKFSYENFVSQFDSMVDELVYGKMEKTWRSSKKAISTEEFYKRYPICFVDNPYAFNLSNPAGMRHRLVQRFEQLRGAVRRRHA